MISVFTLDEITKKSNINDESKESFALHQEGDAANAAHNCASQILDVKYKKQILMKAMMDINIYPQTKEKIKTLLFKYEELFNETLGVWETFPVDFMLEEGARPFHAQAFPVPHEHEAPMKIDLD